MLFLLLIVIIILVFFYCGYNVTYREGIYFGSDFGDLPHDGIPITTYQDRPMVGYPLNFYTTEGKKVVGSNGQVQFSTQKPDGSPCARNWECASNRCRVQIPGYDIGYLGRCESSNLYGSYSGITAPDVLTMIS